MSTPRWREAWEALVGDFADDELRHFSRAYVFNRAEGDEDLSDDALYRDNMAAVEVSEWGLLLDKVLGYDKAMVMAGIEDGQHITILRRVRDLIIKPHAALLFASDRAQEDDRYDLVSTVDAAPSGACVCTPLRLRVAINALCLTPARSVSSMTLPDRRQLCVLQCRVENGGVAGVRDRAA